MQQKHSWIVNPNDLNGSAFTLLATPIVESISAGIKGTTSMKTSLKAILKSTSAKMSSEVIRQLAASTVYQLFAEEHGMTRLVVVCRIDQGIDDEKAAKSGACVCLAWGRLGARNLGD